MQKTVEQFGRLDVLIHNSTKSQNVAFAELQDQDFDRTVDIHLTDLFHVSFNVLIAVLRVLTI